MPYVDLHSQPGGSPILRTNLRFHILGVSTVAVAGVAGVDSTTYVSRTALVSR